MKNRTCLLLSALVGSAVVAAEPGGVPWPPALPEGKEWIMIEGDQLLEAPVELASGVRVAKTPPRVEFHYYDCQTYPGKPWSVWGDGVMAGGKYYSPVGDHLSPEGNAFVYEFDPATHRLKCLLDVRSVLKRKPGHYTPGKIHSQLGVGKDGWIYFTTHRGSTRVALDPANRFEGDSLLRVHPGTGRAEVVVRNPLPMHCLPTGSLDPERMIWYAGSADGRNEEEPQFLAYDIANGKVLHAGGRGPYRAMIIAQSTGRVYFHAGEGEGKGGSEANLHRFDPADPKAPERIEARVGLRAASTETAGGLVYTVDRNELWVFDTRTETATSLGPTVVAGRDYITNLDIDPTGRFLYYIPGAHGGAERDGTPVVQYDTRTRTRKVICFLHPALQQAAGYVPIGSFGSALSEDGSTLYVTWNGAHHVDPGARKVPFQSVAMTAIHIPASERRTE